MRKPTVALINDTSLSQAHFGCRLVCQTFREQFARTGLELKLALQREFELSHYAAQLSAVDLVVINGEGSLHHDRAGLFFELADRYPTVLVNCVYEANTPHPGLKKFLFISARESLSTAEVKRAGAECVTVPDAIFASSLLRSFARPEPVYDLGITDNVVRTYLKFGPLRIRWKRGFNARSPTVAGYLSKLCSYRRLCVGRFHAAVASSVLGIPFATWDSNTWKTRGMMNDMGVPHLHFPTYKAAKENVPTELPEQVKRFASEAKGRVEEMFDRVAAIAHERRK